MPVITHRLLLAALVFPALWGVALAAKAKPVACPAGEFIANQALFPAGASSDPIMIDGSQVGIDGHCAMVAASLRAKKKFTLLKARWKSCVGAPGAVTLAAKMASPACTAMQGTIRLAKTKTKPKARSFTATRSPCDPVSIGTQGIDPGRVTMHRLNRAEYNNTVRDLLGDTTAPANDFPADDHGYGFDNIGDVLAVSPLLLEKYEVAARQVVTNALGTSTGQAAVRYEAEAPGALREGDFTLPYLDEFLGFFATGAVTITVPIAAPGGGYDLSVRTFGQQAGPDPTRLGIFVDGVSQGTFDIAAVEAAPQVVSLPRLVLSAGAHSMRLAFLNDFYAPPLDSNLMVDWLNVNGPFGGTGGRGPRWGTLVPCDPAVAGAHACAVQALGPFLRRAWRRPTAGEEVERAAAVVDQALAAGDGFETALGLGFQAALLSPNFLFRVEHDADPASTAVHTLTDYEVATRLSYLLWSSTPDDALLAAADQGDLSTAAGLRPQVERMLADPRAAAFVQNFSGQWLYTRALADVNPDYAFFPNWDAALADAMRQETALFFDAFLREDRPLTDILDADFTFLNDRLARHYGLAPVGNASLQRVTLSTPERGGVLTHGSLLTVTSRPKRTSPVKRGKFVLEQFLCQAPPPPPANVEALPEPDAPVGTLRERFAQHRNKPECQSCHTVMDPIGFSLENFDGIGAWRTTDGGAPVDATGELPGGTAFQDFHGMTQTLKADRALPRCFTSHFLTYALGRGMEFADRCLVEVTSKQFQQSGGSMRDLLQAIVESDAFRRRRGAP